MRTRSLVMAAGVVAGAAAVVPVVHRRQLTCGATPDEQARPLPGDGLVARADLVATRAGSIAAPPEAVWPWLVQIGQGRGGFYSFDVLENLVGLDIHSADRIVPQWQDLAVGDPVRLAEQVALTAAIVEPDRVLVLHGAGPTDADDADDAPPYDFSWAFVLEPEPERAGCRLVVRERYGYRVPWAHRLVPPMTWVSAVMTAGMLRGLRARAERG